MPGKKKKKTYFPEHRGWGKWEKVVKGIQKINESWSYNIQHDDYS